MTKNNNLNNKYDTGTALMNMNNSVQMIKFDSDPICNDGNDPHVGSIAAL